MIILSKNANQQLAIKERLLMNKSVPKKFGENQY
jgi:hypothetical protein